MASSLIDHIEFAVRDAGVSHAFYEAALAPLGVTLIKSFGPKDTNNRGNRHGFGRDGYPSFWIHDHAITDQTLLTGLQNTRGDQMQNKMLSIKNDRVARVIAALITHHGIRFFSEKMNDLAFSFISPLHAYYD